MTQICGNYGCEHCEKTFNALGDGIDDANGEDGEYTRLYEEERRSQSGKDELHHNNNTIIPINTILR